MKKLYLILLTAIFLAAMTGCDFSASVGSGPALTSYDEAVAAANGADPATTPFQVTSPAFTIQTEEDQTIIINFSNGIVDSASAATNISIYPLSDAADATTAYERGTALSLTPVVYQSSATDSDVVYELDGTTIATSLLEIVVESTLTADNGSVTLNSDGDGIPGEAEDDEIRYVPVTQTANAPSGFTPVATGRERDPLTTFSYRGGTIGYVNAAGNNETYDFTSPSGGGPGAVIDDTAVPTALYLQFDVDGVTPTSDAFDSILLPTSDVVKLQQYENGSWTDVTSTIALDTDVNGTQYATYSVTPSAAFEVGGIYRFAVKKYWETAAFNGYPLFYATADGDQLTNGWEYWEEFTFEDSSADVAAYDINNLVTIDLDSDDDGTDNIYGSLKAGTAVIEVEINDVANEIKASTVSADDFRVVLTNAGGNSEVVECTIGTVTAKPGENNVFKLPIATEYATNGSFRVEMIPGGIIDEGPDDETENDDVLLMGGAGNDFVPIGTGTFDL